MYIRVKVSPGSKKEVFKQENEDHFIVSVKEKALNNAANKRVLEIFSTHFNLPIGKVRIVNGHRSPTKLLIIDKD